MSKNLKITYLDVVLSGLLFNFVQLAVVHELNAVVRYSIFGFLLIIFISKIKITKINIGIALSGVFLFLFLIFINLYHYDSFSFLGVSLTIIPAFVLLFSNTVDISKDNDFYRKISFLHFVIFLFSLYKYRFLLAGADYILNENEIASYSLIVVCLMYFLSSITQIKNTKYLLINTVVSLFIAVIMEARAIEFSIIFIPLVFLFINYKSSVQKTIVKVLMYCVIIIPILMVQYIGALIDFYADLIEQKFGLPAEAIKSELERFDMFSYIRDKLSVSFWGFGIGNVSYMKDIEISGLHSGSLDLMYWGGYVLFISFNLFFIYIINYVLNRAPQLIFACFLIIYYLILQNYYEGLFFGNMGILVMILSMLTTLIIKAKEK